MLNTGKVFTVIVRVAVELQPFAPRPVKVYVVLDAGDTVMLLPLRLPGCQL